MSDTDRGGRDGADERPMLVLGDDLPDVEDTTPEQLRRQQQQARREIEEARRQAQEEIERARREAERELEERERELDRTQRKLYRRESKLLRRQPKGGSTSTRLVPAPAKKPLAQRGLVRSGGAWLAASAAVLCLLVTALTAPGAPSRASLAELEGTDEARVLFLSSAAAATEAITQRLAGREVPPGSVVEHVDLAEEAFAAMPEKDDYLYRNAGRTLERVRTQSGEIFSEDASDVRALTLWGQMHQELGYAVSQSDVRTVREGLMPGAGAAGSMGALATLALGALVLMALRARAWTSLALAGGATVLAVLAFVAVLSGAGGDALDQAAEDHDRTHLFLANVHREIYDDLSVAYGTSTSSASIAGEHWADEPFWLPPEGADVGPYLEARASLGRATGMDEPTVADAAMDLAGAGRALLGQQFLGVEQAREDLVDELRDSGPGRNVTAALAAGSALLAGAALLLSRGRRQAS